jgi:hypothetical protein
MATQWNANVTSGQVLTAATLQQIGAASETYTPTWTSTGVAPAIGNGTLTGQWFRFQRLVVARVFWTPGGTTNFGTGGYRIGLPITNNGSNFIAGYAYYFDGSTFNTYAMVATPITTSTVQMSWNAGGINGTWGQATPVPMAVGDNMSATFIYESA